MCSGIAQLIFFDLEFTAWEDSLRTNWSDPERPAEIVQIGVHLQDCPVSGECSSYSSWVKPSLNQVLSSYSKSLLGVDQAVIDRSPSLATVMKEFYRFIESTMPQPDQACWISWGAEDLELWMEDCVRASALPPPVTTYLDLMRESANILGMPSVCDRADIKRILGVTTSRQRHDALSDAMDLTDIYSALTGYFPAR